MDLWRVWDLSCLFCAGFLVGVVYRARHGREEEVIEDADRPEHSEAGPSGP